MATFTQLDAAQIGEFLGTFDVPPLVDFSGVPGGSVNSNFEVRVAAGRYFLRVYEEQGRDGAHAEAATLAHLVANGVPTAAPLRRRDGTALGELDGKPAALFPWREGTIRCQASVTPEDAFRVGGALATVHLAGADEVRDGGRAARPWSELGEGRFRYDDLVGRLAGIAAQKSALGSQAAPLRRALDRCHGERTRDLPSGLLHGDLFRDNVLWAEDGQISALLDFESAHHGPWVFDLMIAVLAWCVGDALDGALASQFSILIILI